MDVDPPLLDADMQSGDDPAGAPDVDFADAAATTGEDTLMEGDAEMTVDTTLDAEVEMGDEDYAGTAEGGTISYDSETASIVSLADPEPFRSPPRVMDRDEGHQTQALGHSSTADRLAAEDDQGGEEAEARGHEEGSRANGTSHDDEEPEAGPSGSQQGEDDGAGEDDAGDDGAGENGAEDDNKTQSQRDGRALASQRQDDAQDGSNGREQEQTVEDKSRHTQRLTQKQKQDRGNGEEAKQTNEVNIREDPEDGGVEVETEQHNQGPSKNSPSDGPVSQVNVVNVLRQGDDCASNSASGASLRRPGPNKRPLRDVTFGPTLSRYFDHFRGRPSISPTEDAPTGTGHEDGRLRAPPVRLTCDGVLYDLFCPPEELDQDSAADDEDGLSREREDPATKTLFDKHDEHQLYFNHLETLCARLHEAFPQFEKDKDEMVLVFNELGISVPEDNVYTRELSLYDLDRLHVGANLAGRLHVSVERQPRLIHRFNIIAEHVERLLEDDGDDEYYVGGDEEPTQDYEGGAHDEMTKEEKTQDLEDADEADVDKEGVVGGEADEEGGPDTINVTEDNHDDGDKGSTGKAETAQVEEVEEVTNQLEVGTVQAEDGSTVEVVDEHVQVVTASGTVQASGVVAAASGAAEGGAEVSQAPSPIDYDAPDAPEAPEAPADTSPTSAEKPAGLTEPSSSDTPTTNTGPSTSASGTPKAPPTVTTRAAASAAKKRGSDEKEGQGEEEGEEEGEGSSKKIRLT